MKNQRKNIFKLTLLLAVFAAVFLSYDFSSKPAQAYSQSAPPRLLTGAPALGSKPSESDCTDCHTGPASSVNGGPGKVQILDLPATYDPGQTYTIRVVTTQTSISKFGFELTVLDSTGAKAGTVATVDARTSVATQSSGTFAGRQYITHSASSSGGTAATAAGTSEWKVSWTAPATRIGKIGFYASSVAANSNGGDTGDYIYTTSSLVDQSTPLGVVSSADYISTNPVPAAGAASAFGSNLATTTTAASGSLTTSLGGTTVSVKDSLNVTRSALIYFVSPGQVNFQIPDATATGTATITITNSNNVSSTGTVTVVAVQPGVFSLTGDGAGLPVAQLQRVNKTTNAQTFDNTFTLSGATYSSKPITFNANEDTYLVIYANGVRNRSALANVSVSIGGTAITPVYAGTQGFFTGVDQVNVLLPTNLGSGNKAVTITVDGKTSNSTTINFQ